MEALLKRLDDPKETTLRNGFALVMSRLADEGKTTEIFRILDLMRKVVTYESNKVYDYWYFVKETMELTLDERKMVLELFMTPATKRPLVSTSRMQGNTRGSESQ